MIANKSPEPNFVTQPDSYGNPEKVDSTVYSYRIMCTEPNCVSVRHVKSQDRSQTKLCKPHARIARLKLRAASARQRRKRPDIAG